MDSSLPSPHRRNRLGARLGDENDRTALEAEGAPQRTSQILFVTIGEQFIAVDEKQKRRRRLQAGARRQLRASQPDVSSTLLSLWGATASTECENEQ